jgi:hypothetical protein
MAKCDNVAINRLIAAGHLGEMRQIGEKDLSVR